ncbi:hypothetical protein ACS0TY_030542 [Phlomoides rotata]
MDQRVEFESLPPCSSESINENRVIAEDGISMEVDENKSLDEPLSCSLGFQQTCSNDHDGMPTRESDDLSDSIAGNNIAIDMVSMETDIDRLASGDACNKELCFPVSNDERSCNADILASDHLKELHDEAMETVSIQEENIGNNPGLPSGDVLCGDTSVYHEEQPLVPEAGLSLEPSNGSKGVRDESINVAVDTTFTGYNGKKLLVLDVNGLLVDISSYVPYDYDPDDIIMKKAVFKRPHCDDFLKFCFERFNVGVWTSRTKSNVEPILDFLLGSDKCKLLFCWDQSQCTNTGFTTVEKRHKPLLLKKIKKLWNKCDPNLPWEKGVYNESNTLLLDDTPYKALSNPRYTAVFPYTYHFKDVSDNSLGPEGDLRVYLDALADAENVQEYVKQNPFGQRAITEKNLSWGYYRKVIEATSTPPPETNEDHS